MKLATLTSLLAFCSASALATSYQHETKVDYLWGDLLNTEFNSSVFSQQFHFTPVSVNSNAPFAEAAFISRTSSVLLGYQRSRFDFGDEGKSTASSWALGGEYRSLNHNFSCISPGHRGE
ncbi:putative porin [Arsukibacterium sp.]|uniref:putative porin n=1 Tax=Arsukibacterium sp. TaxID=1977258 RepID=UPI002FD9EE69